MKIHIETVTKEKEEQIIIECYEIRQEISEIVNFVKTRDATLEAYLDSQIFYISIQDIFYMDTVDNKVFVYLEEKVYELKNKLYELESLFAGKHFFRCSKSAIVNLMKIDSLAPAFNGRLVAKLINGEEIVISRKYVNELKIKLQGV